MKNVLEILKINNVNLQQSVYLNESREFLNFPLCLPGEFSTHDELLYNSCFPVIKKCEQEIQRYKLQAGYHSLKSQINELDASLKKLKNENDRTCNNYLQISSIREKKGVLVKKIEKLEKDFEYECYKKTFSGINYSENPKSITYNKHAILSSFENICEVIPNFNNINANFLNGVPWFIYDLNKLKNALESKQQIGIEGGSCLFLSDEFYVIVEHKSGLVKKFDYVDFKERSISSRILPNSPMNLIEYIKINGPDIKNIEIDNHKTEITMKDYDMIKYLFEISRTLSAKLIITIPDMTYRKTFYSIFKPLNKDIFSETKDKFFKEFEKLANMNLKQIEIFKEHYKDVDVTVFQNAAKELCEKFYRVQAEMHMNESDINHLTKRYELKDAITDYIFMPALPYYLFGIENIIELNRIEELPSVSKCKKLHKSRINLTGLFPLRLSKSANDSLYYNL